MDIHVQKDGQQLGPFNENRIRQGIDAGEFAPDDLAWTMGKASWQPLSSLINLDVNRPPPLPKSPSLGNAEERSPSIDAGIGKQGSAFLPLVTTAESKEPISKAEIIAPQPAPAEGVPTSPNMLIEPLQIAADSTPKALSANETVLYQEAPNFPDRDKILHGLMSSIPVIVTNRRIKVDDDSYSLEGVNAVSLQILLKRQSFWRLLLRILLWGITWMVAFLALYLFTHLEGAKGIDGWFSAVVSLGKMIFGSALLFAMPCFFAIRASSADKVYRYCVAQIVLIRSGQATKVCISNFFQYPYDDAAVFLKKRDFDDKSIEGQRKHHIQQVERAKMIAEAIGVAIKGNTTAASA